MARFSKHLLSLPLLCGLLLTACQEGSEAGQLLGQWRMEGSATRYIAFSGSITVLRSIDEGEVFGNFQHQGDSLFMQCYSREGLPTDTAVVEQTFGLKPFSDIRLRIVSLTADRLIISDHSRTWTFDKY